MEFFSASDHAYIHPFLNGYAAVFLCPFIDKHLIVLPRLPQNSFLVVVNKTSMLSLLRCCLIIVHIWGCLIFYAIYYAYEGWRDCVRECGPFRRRVVWIWWEGELSCVDLQAEISFWRCQDLKQSLVPWRCLHSTSESIPADCPR